MTRAMLSVLATTASVLAYSGQASGQTLTGGPNDFEITVGALERGSEPVGGRDAFLVKASDAGQALGMSSSATVSYDFGDLSRSIAFGQVLPGLSRFYGVAMSPFPLDNVYQGSQVVIDINRSYFKVNDTASISYTYTTGVLDLVSWQPPEQRCIGFKCMYAEVSAYAAVYNKDREQVWYEEQIATLFLNASGKFETSTGTTRSGSGLRNKEWSWIPNLGDAKATFTLDGDYSAKFDLSGINVGEGFTVNYIMGLRAVDKGSGGPSSSRAFAVDPVSYISGSGNGFELIASGGVSPIPEPASWVLLLSGLLAVLAAVRRARTKAPAGRTVA
jgi:hypothetical protein